MAHTKNKRSWGSDITPKCKWIDPNKMYTCGGKRVINICVELRNSCTSFTNEVIYPVKGIIVTCEKPFKTLFSTWSLDGRQDIQCYCDNTDLKVVK